MKTKDLIRLVAPDSGITVYRNGITYLLKQGQDFIVSDRCDPENKIASFKGGGYPLIHIEFATKHEQQFKIIEHGTSR